MGVVAVAKEDLGVCCGKFRIKVRDYGDLIIATNGREDRTDRGVTKRRIDVSSTILGCGAQSAGGGILHGDKSSCRDESAHRLLVDRWRESGSSERRRKNSDPIAWNQFGRG